MGVIFKTDKRRIIPRWRSFEVASQTGELNYTLNSNIEFKNIFNSTEYLKEQINAWKENNNLIYAGDLLSSAYVLGLESEFKEVAKFIISNDPDEFSPLVKVAKKVLKLESSESPNITKDTKNKINDKQKYFPEIKKYKYFINKEPRNPIAWIELGRLYSIIGLVKKAKKCVDRALYLDKNNRFIVRSASRFYHHYHSDLDNALQIIKKSSNIGHDPWLISAEIAYSSTLGRFSRLVKPGKIILENKKNNLLAITELASAVGTVEFDNGKPREAKKYFKQSLLNPTDNSLAQAGWMANALDGIIIESTKFDLPFAFEAKTLAEYEDQNFESAFENAMKWQLDEPYSTRPILTASYISGVFLNQLEYSISLIEDGLEINPNDSQLINNLVYFLVKVDKIDEATEIFERKLAHKLSDTKNIETITLTATAGLLLYRNNYPEEGKKFYTRALDLATLAKNDYLYSLAFVNYGYEEIRLAKTKHTVSEIYSEIKEILNKQKESDIKLLCKEAIKAFENK